MKLSPIRLFWLTFVLGGCLIGCAESPEIQHHRIPRAQSGLDNLRIESVLADWTRGPTNSMVVERFSKLFDGKRATISVTPLPAQEWISNVQRWNGQVGIELTPEEITAQTTEVEVDGIASQRIKLVSEKEDGQAIVGIMTVKGNSSWFLKLMGPKAAVEAAEADFDRYAGSYSIP